MNLEGENHDPYMHHDTRTREKSEFLMAGFWQEFGQFEVKFSQFC